MAKTMAINQIEKQIEALPPIEQVMILERLVLHLKQLVLSQQSTATQQIESKEMTGKLNNIYKLQTSRLDSDLLTAQISSLSRDEWQ
jgi:long-subunit acyl-CoA synthetase (AMP-forming)